MSHPVPSWCSQNIDWKWIWNWLATMLCFSHLKKPLMENNLYATFSPSHPGDATFKGYKLVSWACGRVGTVIPKRISWWLLARAWKDKNGFKNVLGGWQKPHYNTALFGITLKKKWIMPVYQRENESPLDTNLILKLKPFIKLTI